MIKTILLTGSTDGIGFETAKMLVAEGHTVLLHGRNQSKLNDTQSKLKALNPNAHTQTYCCDLSILTDVKDLSNRILSDHQAIDIIINNAGIFKTNDTVTKEGFETRFAVNTIAPYLLTKQLLPILSTHSRVINVSSAAQSPVELSALIRALPLPDFNAYSQSKLAITMWSRYLATHLENPPIIISVNPASMLGSKMVKEGFGVDGGDLSIGAKILFELSLDEKHSDKSGMYFDNDARQYGVPHADALDENKCLQLIMVLDEITSHL